MKASDRKKWLRGGRISYISTIDESQLSITFRNTDDEIVTTRITLRELEFMLTTLANKDGKP